MEKKNIYIWSGGLALLLAFAACGEGPAGTDLSSPVTGSVVVTGKPQKLGLAEESIYQRCPYSYLSASAGRMRETREDAMNAEIAADKKPHR
ncbi:MAG: hypothetical protein LBG72_05840 [Spirochaetaceae bacterium]|nr:hypothetical protein [Spirochaetaceae bacterium]